MQYTQHCVSNQKYHSCAKFKQKSLDQLTIFLLDKHIMHCLLFIYVFIYLFKYFIVYQVNKNRNKI